MQEIAVHRPSPHNVVTRGGTLLSERAVALRPATALERPRSDVRRLVVWGCALFVLTFGTFGVWAGAVPLRSAVIASGVVKVLSMRRAVQHFEGGIVKEILVRENQRVERDQVLARLDTTQIEAGLGVLETRLFADLAKEARLEAEQSQAKTIAFPEELRMNALRPEARQAIQSQEAEFAARAASLEGERNLIDQRTAQLQSVIRGLEASTAGLQQQLAFLQEEIKDSDQLLAKGLARKPRVLALKRAEADVEGQIARNNASIAEARGKLAELDDRRRQLVYNRSQEIAEQRHKTREEIADLRHRIAGLRDKLARSELRAPEQGIVVGLNTRNLNAVLGPRETLLEIVPIQDRLVIEALLKPSDRDEVHAGQAARVRVLAFNMRRTPMLTGKVTAVSADALLDQKTGVTSYKTEVVLDSNDELAPYLSTLQPGMPVEVFIETGERTFAEYLLQPVLLRVNRAFRES
jgi:HlyD family type I secretion membrane fusion protein